MNKLENLMELAKLNDLLGKKDKKATVVVEEKKKHNTVLCILGIIAIVLVIVGVAYAI